MGLVEKLVTGSKVAIALVAITLSASYYTIKSALKPEEFGSQFERPAIVSIEKRATEKVSFEVSSQYGEKRQSSIELGAMADKNAVILNAYLQNYDQMPKNGTPDYLNGSYTFFLIAHPFGAKITGLEQKLFQISQKPNGEIVSGWTQSAKPYEQDEDAIKLMKQGDDLLTLSNNQLPERAQKFLKLFGEFSARVDKTNKQKFADSVGERYEIAPIRMWIPQRKAGSSTTALEMKVVFDLNGTNTDTPIGVLGRYYVGDPSGNSGGVNWSGETAREFYLIFRGEEIKKVEIKTPQENNPSETAKEVSVEMAKEKVKAWVDKMIAKVTGEKTPEQMIKEYFACLMVEYIRLRTKVGLEFWTEEARREQELICSENLMRIDEVVEYWQETFNHKADPNVGNGFSEINEENLNCLRRGASDGQIKKAFQPVRQCGGERVCTLSKLDQFHETILGVDMQISEYTSEFLREIEKDGFVKPTEQQKESIKKTMKIYQIGDQNVERMDRETERECLVAIIQTERGPKIFPALEGNLFGL